MKNTLMLLIVSSTIGIAWLSGYHTGQVDGGIAVRHAAMVDARQYYYRQEQSDKRVAAIIKKNDGYKAGWNACMEQF